MDAPVAGELGKYRLIAELARGGMGIVYLAIVPGPGGFYKTLVIKELKPDLASDPSFLGMFLDEARVAAKLQHPNIVQVNEVDTAGDRTFLAMEYLEGCTLRRALKVLRPKFTTRMHLEVLSEILRGLHHAHELMDESQTVLGLVHRDMNPHNIFLTFDGQAKIVDFGIVKTLDSSQHTQTGVFKGKVAYMPPEQAMADIGIDRRADIYSVGVMVWEAAAGRRLWKGLQDMHILTKLVQKDIPLLETVKPDAPAALKRICGRAMSWSREERYATAEEFRLDLDRYLKASGSKPSMRDIGALLGLEMSEERAAMRALVDRKIAQLKAGGPASQLVSIAPPSSTSGVGDADESGPIVAIDDATLDAARRSNPVAVSAEDESEAESSAAFLPNRWQLTPGRFLVVAALVVAVAVYLTFIAPSKTPSTAVLHDGAAHSALGATSAPPVPEMIDVEVRVIPASAKVAIDDVILTGAPPYSLHYPKESKKHVARASAPDYQTRTQEFTGDRDVVLDLSLASLHGGANVAAQPGRDTSQTTAAGSSSSLRPIDTTSPYSRTTGAP